MPIEGITVTDDIGIQVDDDGTPQIFETPGGRGRPGEVEITYIAPWAKATRFALYNQLLGGFGQLHGLGVPTPGHAYPEDPNFTCEAIGRVNPLGVNRRELELNPDPAFRRWNYAKYCTIPCTYRRLEYAYNLQTANTVTQIDPEDPILGCKQTTEVNNSFIVVDKARMEILTPGGARQDPRKVVEATDGIPANTVAFNLEYPRVPRHPYPFLRPFIGRVNAFPMWGLPPGHVLLANLAVEQAATYRGVELSASLGFIGNIDVSWNETLDDDGIVKPKVFVNNDGSEFKYPFQYADLMLALR